MITLHHLDNSRSQRILWMLEELGLKYEVKHHKRDAKTMLAPPSLRAVHPLGRAPVLVDDGLVLCESGAILEYLVDKYGRSAFKPKMGTPEFIRYTFWMHFAEGSAMPPLILKMIFDKVENPPIPMIAKPFVLPVAIGISSTVKRMLVTPVLKSHRDYMEAELSKTEWFAGSDFSAADIQMSFVVEAHAARTDMTATHPRVTQFRKRIQARPAYKKAIEVGGPFSLA